MKTIVILTGIQGSGKSEYCRRFLSDRYVRVNLDTLRTRARERALLEECFAAGRDIAVDNTNPTADDRRRYIVPAKAAGYRVIGVLIEPDLPGSLARNARREGRERIPEKGVVATYRKLEPPRIEEGFDALYLVRNDGVTFETLTGDGTEPAAVP